MALIIDGNNFIKRYPSEFELESSDISRTALDRLVRILADFRRRLLETQGKKQEITVVFDGSGQQNSRHNVTVIYGNGKSADMRIKEIAKHGASGAELVSDDRDLRDFFMEKGGIATDCAKFHRRIAEILSGREPRDLESSKYNGNMSEEEKAYWARKFGIDKT